MISASAHFISISSLYVLQLIEVTPSPPLTPCIPSPCGPNAECRPVDSRAVCSCLPGMFGAPPNCRPECVINQDCPSHLACVSNKCTDPCVGSCGINAQCVAQNHRPICSCFPGYEGDPFSGCSPVQGKSFLQFLFSCFLHAPQFYIQFYSFVIRST